MSTRERVPSWVTAVGMGVPLLVCLTAGLLLVGIRDELPVSIVRHWGVDGRPNGWSSFAAVVAFTTVMPLALVVALLAVGLVVNQERAMAALAGGSSTFLATLVCYDSWQQRGLPAGAAPHTTGDVFWALAAGLVVGVLVWLLVRRRGPLPESDGRLPAGARTVPGVGATARLSWTGIARRPRGLYLALLLPLVPSLGFGAWAMLQRNWVMGLFCLLVAAAVGLVTAAAFLVRVRVDHRGVRAVGAGLVRWVSIPIATVRSAEVVQVRPLADHGGWGLRGGRDGTRALVTAAGSAVRIHRAHLGDVLITVRDAEGAAATLNTLVARRGMHHVED